MKLNEGKCYLLAFGTSQDDIKITVGEAIVKGNRHRYIP